MADEAAMAAAAALIEDIVDPVEAVLGQAPVQAGNLFENDVAGQEQAPGPEQTEPQQETIDLSAYTADTTGLDWLEEEEVKQDDDEDYTIAPSFDDDEVVTPQAESWDDDEEKAQLRKQLARLQKQTEWAEKQRIDALHKKWQDEAARRFPLSSPGAINATSRRATLREAKAQHDLIAQKIKPILDALQAEKTTVVQEATQEGKQAAVKAWGQPSAGIGQFNMPGPTPVGNPKFERGKGLVDLIKDKLGSGEYGQI